MPAPESYDLRAKAINAVKEGTRKTAVCRMLKISRNTLDLWLKREQETGDFRAITNYQQGRPLKIQNLEAFRPLVQQHKDKTQQHIAKLWGDNLTQQNVSDAFKKLGITRKKASASYIRRATPNVRRTQDKLMGIKRGMKNCDNNFWTSWLISKPSRLFM